MAERVSIQCSQCGQTDDHPKVHIGNISKHNDCLSFEEESMVRNSSDVASQVIDACKDGKRGNELLSHIESLHEEN